MNILITPRATEKAYGLSGKNVYVFNVPLTANKQQIAAAVAEQYEVKVINVTTAVQAGKAIRFSRGKNRYPGTTTRKDSKKAYVTLAEGNTIQMFEQPETSERGEEVMPIKAYNPTTPARRGMTSEDYSDITTRKPLKSLVKSKKQNAGRNNTGRITIRHRGGGVKRHYRLVNHRLAAGLTVDR